MKKTGEQTYELRYTGYLTESPDVYLHYGYTDWTDVSECKMRKLKTCYKTEITLPEGAELNFCFRDENGQWDNNYGNNYWYMPSSNNDYNYVEITSKEPKTTKVPATKTKSATTVSKAKAKTITTRTKKDK